MAVACLMPFFQQVSGNDAVLFYGTFLFKLAGFGDNAVLYSTIIIGLCALSAISLSIFLVDRLGRRKLLLLGCALMISSLTVVGSIFGARLRGNVWKLPSAETVSEVVINCIFVIGFAISLGPLAWLIPSEILSQNVRSAGQSIVVFTNMLFKFAIAQTFLSMLCAFKYGVFFFFAGWMFVLAAFVILFLPETKHVPIYKIDSIWVQIYPTI